MITPPSLRADRVTGRIYKAIPDISINTVRTALTKEITEALHEAGVPTVLSDPYRRDAVNAFSAAQVALMDEKKTTEDALLEAKQLVAKFLRGVGR